MGPSVPAREFDPAGAVLWDGRVPKYDAFGREIGEDTLSGLGGEAPAGATPQRHAGSDGGAEAAAGAAGRDRRRPRRRPQPQPQPRLSAGAGVVVRRRRAAASAA